MTIEENPDYNPFLAPYLEVAIPLGSKDISAQSVFSTIGGLDVTNIANGIAQFMIKRAKEELTIAFFERFRDFADKNPEFQVLFPATTDNLENLLAYKYPDLLPALRSGFFEDLRTISLHLDDVLELPRYHALLKDLPEIRIAVRSIRLIHEIESGESHAADILKKFAELEEWNESSNSTGFKNFGSSVKLAAIISNSLRNDTAYTDSEKAWITYKQADTLVSNDTIFNIYTGLIYQLVKNKTVWFYPERNNPDNIIEFDKSFARHRDNLFLVKNKVIEFIELANKVDKVLDTLNETNNLTDAFVSDGYYNYIDVSADIIEYGFSIARLFSEELDITEYVAIAKKSNDLSGIFTSRIIPWPFQMR